MKIAISHPGRIGDLLYCLPTVKHIAKILNVKIDFWTSEYCKPLVSLLKKQFYINDVFVAKNYIVDHHECGTQPWKLLPEKDYDKIYILGLREYPQCPLVEYYPRLCGFTFCDTRIWYDFTKKEMPPIDKPEFVVCPGRNPLLKGLFVELIAKLSAVGVVYQIGPKSETINMPGSTILNIDFADTLPYLDRCTTFFGTLSANLVLANGFNCQKVVICEKERHNPVHDVHSERHNYIKFPTNVETLLCAGLN